MNWECLQSTLAWARASLRTIRAVVGSVNLSVVREIGGAALDGGDVYGARSVRGV